MKRFLIIMLLFVMSLTLCFAACGNTEDSGIQNGGGSSSEQPVDGGNEGNGDEEPPVNIMPVANQLPLVPLS